MLDFISENFILCITVLGVMFGIVVSMRLKNSEVGGKDKFGRNFMNMSLKEKHIKLIGLKRIRLIYLVMSALLAVVTFCKLENNLGVFMSVAVALIVAVIIAFVFFEFILISSEFLFKLIAVNNTLLNGIFSSVIIIISVIFVHMLSVSRFGFSEFLLSGICLISCYIMTVFVLIMIINEANDNKSSLTFANLWKSALLTIILFLFILSLMSYDCYLYDVTSFAGVQNSIFDMFYYTVVTFATVGYGDIVPTSIASKSVSVLTVFTSILCITVLLSEIVEVKRHNGKNDT